jgi:geranylgeranyl pyrophosphate synthase
MNRSAVPPPVTMVLDAADAWLPARMEAVEERLGRLVEGHGPTLAADAGATLASGGKRLRPMLVLLSAGPGAGEAAVRAATAIELVHMATLVHDDVLDAAPLRRGRPTVVARSGRGRALAVGDLLFSRAFAELGKDGSERQVELLSRATVALALGELAQRRDAFDLSISAERYMERCELKTARLFECACVIGRVGSDVDGAPRQDPFRSRLAGGVRPPVARSPVAAMRTFGGAIGLAFQLLDDVLDVTGPAERTGKARGTDLLDGTVTLPLILARERDPSLARIDLRNFDAQGAEAVCDRIAATGVLEEVRDGARKRVAEAKRALAESSLDPDQRRLLQLVADGVVERYS